jgi:NADPH:quinone reductase-like Zn-dependent oxidoreductase
MKAIQVSEFGRPAEVARLTEIAEPGRPGAGEVTLEVEAAPINPSDLLMMRGFYGVRPALPAVFGTEGVAKVIDLGAGVEHLKVGDIVLVPYQTPSWQERLNVGAKALFALPAEADRLQLAMFGINPATAHLMLTSFVTLRPGDWVVQNAANSGVGRAVIAIAKQIGLRTVNIVRREELVEELQALGGDVVLSDGKDLAKRAAQATERARIALGLEAVGGESTLSLMSCLAPGAKVVNYAGMSAQPAQAAQPNIIFKRQSIEGFWLVNWFQDAKPEEVSALYRQLLPLLLSGGIHVPIEATYALADFGEALAHASKAKAKVLFKMR